MDHHIAIQLDDDYQLDASRLMLAASHALRTGGIESPVGLTVQITSGEAVHALNRKFAGNDYPTDVLSFPAEDGAYQVEPGEPPYIGDVIIAYDVASKQAHEAGTPLDTELQTLAIHGVLHLQGYDHDTPSSQAEMWALQSAALDAVRADGS